MAAASSSFTCDVLHAAAPLIRTIHDLAHEWSLPRQRKGKPIDAAVSRGFLCNYDGSPCPLFASPEALLAGFAALLKQSASRALTFHAADASATIAGLAASLTASGAQRSSTPDALLLPLVLAPLYSGVAPPVIIIVSGTPLSAAQWRTQLVTLASRLGNGYNGNTSAFLFPQASTPPEPAAATRGRRVKKLPNPPAMHTSAVLWRTSADCTLPLYDLSRPLGSPTASEVASARGSVGANLPYSEWFTCRTLEVLRPLVRNLFRLPRRKGKSVWHTCMRPSSPCFWFTGAHHRGEHFVTQVLSSPDVLLSRLSSHRDASNGKWPPLLLLDPAAGEGNYTQHLPDGMGRVPPWQLVSQYGWNAVLGEPIPETHKWLKRHFARFVQSGRATLLTDGVTPQSQPTVATMFWLDAHVPELSTVYEKGLPMVTRQRLQWGSSLERGTALSVRGDLWLFNHLAGGPILEALEVNGHVEAAKAFRDCKHNSAKAKKKCFNATVATVNVTLRPWSDLIARIPSQQQAKRHIDLLILDQRDPYVTDLLKAFPFDTLKPSLIYYRTSSGSGVRKLLLSHGYQTSAHHETSAWGENTIAWRADRCDATATPLWSKVAAMLPPSMLPPPEEKIKKKARGGRRLRRGA